MAVDFPEIEMDELVDTDSETGLDVPWNVVVFNDPVNLMSYVTMVFEKVFAYGKERSEKHMMEVHELGRSIVWSGVREKAEYYVERLHSFQLLAAMEHQSR